MPKVKKKRMGWVMDMTPLVDITFLLLTFLMFTAKFKTDNENRQDFKIIRPVASADTTKLPDKNLAQISINIDDQTGRDTVIYFGMSERASIEKVHALRDNETLKLTPEQKKKLDDLLNNSLVVVDTNTLGKFIRMTAAQLQENVTWALDADKELSFDVVWRVMNIMKENNARVFNYVTTRQK